MCNAACHAAARSVNPRMTASYWEIGRRIVGAAQKGRRRVEYGDPLIARLSSDLTARFGRGFSAGNRENMRRFYLVSPPPLSRDFRDAVSEKRGRLTLQEFPDSVWEIGSRRTGAGPHAAVVGLRAAAVGQRRSCPPVCAGLYRRRRRFEIRRRYRLRCVKRATAETNWSSGQAPS